MECIFCEIVAGELPSHRVWEDTNYLAFLSIFPNTKGVTVVIPKKHFSSYVFALEDDILQDFIIAVKKVAKRLDTKLPTNIRTALVFEGFGVDHVHAKLFPMHGEKTSNWKPIESHKEDYYEQYPGYIASHDSKRADDAALAALAELLRGLICLWIYQRRILLQKDFYLFRSQKSMHRKYFKNLYQK